MAADGVGALPPRFFSYVSLKSQARHQDPHCVPDDAAIKSKCGEQSECGVGNHGRDESFIHWPIAAEYCTRS
jgi:hypothetical protein